MKISELQGVALDWAVAKCEGKNSGYEYTLFEPVVLVGLAPYAPSTDWGQGGPIIEQCCINVYYDGGGYWCGTTDSGDPPKFGPTPLVAAMRCYVASKLGDEIEVPEELA